MTTEERLGAAEARIAELEALLAQQSAYIRELEGRLAKDGHNSSKPPSSDGLRRPLRLVATPDVVVEYRLTVCVGCQQPLPAAAPVVVRERRQVRDLPPVRLIQELTIGVQRQMAGKGSQSISELCGLARSTGPGYVRKPPWTQTATHGIGRLIR